MSFDGKVILITGASNGIGADAARHLSKLGAKVAIVGRNAERLHKVADQIKASGAPTPFAIVADVTKDSERIVDETVKHFGKLDVLVNNAGIVSFDTTSTMQMTEFDRLFDTNVRSVINLTKLCVPHLEKTKGNVVNVSSVSGMMPVSAITSYCMTKAALDQFTKCSALDLAPKGIRVNSINPAGVRTFQLNSGQHEQMMESFKTMYPIGRIGETSDTNAAIAYLADDTKASFLTGILLPVDGGALVGGKVM